MGSLLWCFCPLGLTFGIWVNETKWLQTLCCVFCSETSDFVLRELSKRWFSCIMVHLLIWPWTQYSNNYTRSRQGFICILKLLERERFWPYEGRVCFENTLSFYTCVSAAKTGGCRWIADLPKGDGKRLNVFLLIYLFICGNKMVLTFRWSSIF